MLHISLHTLKGIVHPKMNHLCTLKGIVHPKMNHLCTLKGIVHPKMNHLCTLKGIVHPKMKTLSSFTCPEVVPNLYECVCSEHKGRYSEECGNRAVLDHSICFLLWKSMVPKNSLITNFLQNIFLCVRHKHIHTGLERLEGE